MNLLNNHQIQYIMENKDRFNAFAKVAAIIIWASIALGTTFAVWNAGAGETPSTFIKIIAGLNILTNAAGIFFAVKLLKPLK